MKKSILTFGLVALFGLGISSCSKCTTCNACPDGISLTDDSGNEVSEQEYCESDFENKSDYDLTISLAEGFECTCK